MRVGARLARARQEALEPPHHLANICRFALPKLKDIPSHCLELFRSLQVSLSVASDLCRPEVSARCRHHGESASRMAMPKAAVDANYFAPPWKDDVRSSWASLACAGETDNPRRARSVSPLQLWLRILAAYARHHGTAFFRRHYVCQMVLSPDRHSANARAARAPPSQVPQTSRCATSSFHERQLKQALDSARRRWASHHHGRPQRPERRRTGSA